MNEVTAEMIERGRGADQAAVAQRRRAAADIREARERLTSSGSGHRAFDIELLRAFAQGRRASMPAMVLLAIMIAAMSTVWVAPSSVFLWISLMFSAMALVTGFCQQFLSAPIEEHRAAQWQRKFILAEGILGVVWALLVGLLIAVPDPSARTFVLLVLLLVAAMTAMISSNIPGAVYAGMTPITLASIAFELPRLGLGTLPILLLAVSAQVCFIVLARRLYSTSLVSLSFRAEKDSLIAELEQAKANSDEARRRAEEANLAKSRFLATMSHELRTPLNAILGFSEVMKGELFGAHAVAAYRDYSNDIHSSGQHLLMLINEILDLSRVEAGRYELKEESVSLAHVVEDCCHLLTLRATKRDLVMTETIEPELPRIWADERAVRQVTLNLLSNAIKFTPQGGSITIKVGYTAAGGQYLAIRDTGPGIPEDEIPIIMSSFGRGSLAQKNADEGSGLGLPIVKGLIELHGGTFTLRSRVREGTEVIVVFPPYRVMNALPRMQTEDGAAATRARPAA